MLKVLFFALFVAVAHAQTGGFVHQTEVSAEVLELANWAASSLSSSEKHSVLSVNNVYTQVVSGINYNFTIELLVDGKATKSCEISVFVQPWNNIKQFNAEPMCTEPVAVSSLGGYTPKPVNDEAKALAQWAAASFTEGKHAVVAISGYRTQIVNGVNHKFTLELLVDGSIKKTCKMSIYVQSWTNTIRHFEEPRCSAARVGSFTPAEVDDRVKELANWSASQLSTLHGDKHAVIKIENVQKQIVNGINYKFTLALSVNGKDSKTCEMSVYDQPWTGIRKFFSAPRCTGDNSSSIVGGFKPSEVTETVKEIASWAAAALSAVDEHTVVTIKNVQTQVVNGINYKFTLELLVNGKATKSCEMSVFDQPWTQTRRFFGAPRCTAARETREAVVGGFQPSEVTDKVKEIASWSAAALSAVDKHAVVAIKNVQTQVVAGVNYKFTLELLVNGKLSKSCEMSVFDKPWTNERHFFAEPRCTFIETEIPEPIVGGFVDSEVTPKVQELASWFTSQLASSNVEHNIVEIKNVKTQVVSGIKYKFDIVMHIPSQKVTKTCKVSIFEQSWTNTRYHFEYPQCSEVEDSTVVGGYVPQDVVSAEAMEVAQWATAEFSRKENAASNSIHPFYHSLSAVKNLRTQVVAGINYKFTVQMTVSHPPSLAILTKNCEMTVFVQPWTGTKQFLEEPVCGGI